MVNKTTLIVKGKTIKLVRIKTKKQVKFCTSIITKNWVVKKDISTQDHKIKNKFNKKAI